MNLVCRTELLTAKMVEDRNPAQDMLDITGHAVHENASYDKDVVEVKLADTVVSSDYGGNFVKDVCIDDGHRKISQGKIVDEKSSPNFDCLMIDANSDPRHGRKNDARKSAHELKPEIILPVGFAPDGNNEKQNNSCEEYDLEEMSTSTKFSGDLVEKKTSLEELFRLESAEESHHEGAISTESSENHIPPPLHGEAVGQVSINGCHGVEAIASKTSDPDNTSIPMKDNADGFSATPSAERDAAPSSTSSDIQSSEKSNDQNENLASEFITDALDETAVASSSSGNIGDPSGANRENHVHDFNQRDEENCVDTMNKDTVGSTQAQKDNVGELVKPDSAKVTTRTGNDYLFEPDLFGPSIMSATVSNSGHIAYSGNVSIRSDGSTTSARSFAFPVLQREWISSPVRMAKGERRCIRRRRSWRKGLLCCQF